MDGVLAVDKPSGMTSHDVVAKIRRAAGVRNVGHAGTLDPMATGVLVVALGRATRIIRFLDTDPKEYVAGALFGLETDSEDVTGAVISDSDASGLSASMIEDALAHFRGEIDQVPPMVSAIKVGGEPLYKAARRGERLDIPPRRVTVYELELLEFKPGAKAVAGLRVVCSSGTYVRSLARDIGRTVKTGATLESLRRTVSGSFSVRDATQLSELVDRESVERQLMGMDKSLAHLPVLAVRDEAVRAMENGRAPLAGEIESADDFDAGETIRVTDRRGLLISVAASKICAEDIGKASSNTVVAKHVAVLTERTTPGEVRE